MGKIEARDVTVIVPTRGRKDRVGALLAALNHPHDRTLIVVDEGREGIDLPASLNGQIIVKCKPDAGSVKAWEAGIVAAATSHVLLLNDDVELEAGCLAEAIRFYNERFPNGDGVVGLNHGPLWAHIACFALMPKMFYMEYCYPTPFKRYCVDNEFTEKAKALGLYARCETARLTHDFPPHQEPDHTNDWNIFIPRLEAWMSKVRVKTTKPKVFIAVPVLFNVDPNFFSAMISFIVDRPPFDYQLGRLVGDADISRARNNLTMGFMKSNCTHLLFVDSDLIFSADQIERLIGHNEDIVGGFYPKKKQTDVPEWVCNVKPSPEKMDPRRLTEVNYMGTGFLCIRRNVIEKMLEVLGDELVYAVDENPGQFGFDLWRRGVYKYPDGNRRYLTEDWYFCQTAIDLGFKVWGDNSVILKHSGNAIYPLESQEKIMRELGLFGSAPDKVVESIAAASVASPPREAAATFA
jgi:hypothetical protein